jgi:hypothetical protein
MVVGLWLCAALRSGVEVIIQFSLFRAEQQPARECHRPCDITFTWM